MFRPSYSRTKSPFTTEQRHLLRSLKQQSSPTRLIEPFLQHQYNLPSKIRFKISSIEHLFHDIMIHSRESLENNIYFHSLSSNDRSILRRTTMRKSSLLRCCCIIFNSDFINDPIRYGTLLMIFGQSTIDHLVRTIKLLHSDQIFLEIIYMILIFTIGWEHNENLVHLEDFRSVLNIQHIYMDLLGRYLHSKINERRIISCFSNLIRSLFLLDALFAKSTFFSYV